MPADLVFGVAEFVTYLNQTLEVAYPFVSIEGELSNFRVSKNRLVYFDLKDEHEAALITCFAVVQAMPGPLEDGMRVRVSGSPRLHPLYNFSFQTQQITLMGEGSLRKAADLLRTKLEAEGLFDESRKRVVPYAPKRVALITAGQSAAYADFLKITRARWGGVLIDHFDVLVQGEDAPKQIVRALDAANALSNLPEVIVLIRGGGSTEDLAAFSTEKVVRAVANSRVPTLVAIGHETDMSLAELAADVRASTPSNAAELLFPDKRAEARHVAYMRAKLDNDLDTFIAQKRMLLAQITEHLDNTILQIVTSIQKGLLQHAQMLDLLDPKRPLMQGFALLNASDGSVIRSIQQVAAGDEVRVQLHDGEFHSNVTSKKEMG